MERLNRGIAEHEQNIWEIQVEMEEQKVKISDEEDRLGCLRRMRDDITAEKPLAVQFCQMVYAMEDGIAHTCTVDRYGNFIPLLEHGMNYQPQEKNQDM